MDDIKMTNYPARWALGAIVRAYLSTDVYLTGPVSSIQIVPGKISYKVSDLWFDSCDVVPDDKV